MRYGTPYAAGWGSPENHVAYTILDTAYMDPAKTSVLMRFLPRTGYGDAYFGVYYFGRFLRNIFAPEGEESQVRVPIPYGSSVISAMPIRIGHLADAAYRSARAFRVSENVEGQTATLQITWNPEITEARDDADLTSGWSLTGLELGKNCRRMPGTNTRGELDLDFTVSGGVVTVTLAMAGFEVASGSATLAGPTVVTLTESNDSGLSGSVTMDGASVTTSGAKLNVRWPAQMKILRDTSDPPTTVVATINFDGRNVLRYTDTTTLTAGNTYYYRVKPVSDTGQDGTVSASASVTITGVPAPPTALAYASGTAAATVVSFTNSVTAGATYRAYIPQTSFGVFSTLAGSGAQTNFNDIAATAAAGAGQITLPAIANYPGIVPVVIRAVSGGNEERNLMTLLLEYDAAGNIVPNRPNTPGVQLNRVAVTSGLDISIPCTYDPRDEAGTATKVKLFTRDADDSTSTYNFAAADAEATLGSEVNGVKSATISHSFLAGGWYYCKVLASTAGGTLSTAADGVEFLVYVSTSTVPAGALTAEISRN